MRKFLTAGLAALTLAGGMMATATPASAAPHGWSGNRGGWSGNRGSWGGFRGGWRGGDRGWRGGWDDDGGAALAAGVIGLGLGAALAHPYYNDGYYDDGYYGYSSCYGRERVWDPYVGAYVIERVRYAC